MKSHRQLILLLVIVLLAVGAFAVYWVSHSHSVTLTWNASPGATSYNVYRKRPGELYVRIGMSETTRYKDKDVVSGAVYFYSVKAVKDRQQSDFSNEVRVEIP